VRYSYQHPIETFQTNVLGTVSAFEAARNCESVKAIVNITSDKCYENLETDIPYKETDRFGGYDPYSASKGCAELVVNSFRNSFFNLAKYKSTHHILLASARAGNVIGGGDWALDRLIPDVVRAGSRGEAVIIRSPKATRPWQHVLEPLSGYLLLGHLLL
jgi:CDP-glucose 4,6-dehydratase